MSGHGKALAAQMQTAPPTLLEILGHTFFFSNVRVLDPSLAQQAVHHGALLLHCVVHRVIQSATAPLVVV
jgi:hypothetical protein